MSTKKVELCLLLLWLLLLSHLSLVSEITCCLLFIIRARLWPSASLQLEACNFDELRIEVYSTVACKRRLFATFLLFGWSLWSDANWETMRSYSLEVFTCGALVFGYCLPAVPIWRQAKCIIKFICSFSIVHNWCTSIQAASPSHLLIYWFTL